jgi:hypothetical protein
MDSKKTDSRLYEKLDTHEGRRGWCMFADLGDYLALYDDSGDGRCGYTADELSQIDARLYERGLIVVGDKLGLVVARRVSR